MLGFGIREKTTTTGTGNLTLTAESGYPRVSDAFSINIRVWYSIVDAQNKPIEHGIGYLSDTSTFVRERVIATYSGGVYSAVSPSAVNLAAGDKYLIVTHGPSSAGAVLPGVNGINATKGVLLNTAVSSGGTVNPGASNKLEVWPVLLDVGMAYDAAGIQVTTAEAGKTAVFAIYAAKADGWAGNLLAQCSYDLSTTGIKYSTWTGGGGPIFLPPGWYYCAWTMDASSDGAKVNGVGLNAQRIEILSPLGTDGVLRPYFHARKDIATPLTMPNPMDDVSGFTILSSGSSISVPSVVLRIA